MFEKLSALVDYLAHEHRDPMVVGDAVLAMNSVNSLRFDHDIQEVVAGSYYRQLFAISGAHVIRP